MSKSIFLVFLAFTITGSAQDYKRQSRELFFYNVAFGGVVAGVGSAIHKHDHESTFRAFTNGFWKGCIGGGMNYLGKDFTRHMNKNINYGWGATLIHATGSSFIRNGARNEGLLADWQMEIGFGSFSTKNGFRLHPASASLFIYSAFHASIDFKSSIATGKMYFKSREGDCVTRVNSITINRKFTEKNPHRESEIVIHEFIHALQEEEYCTINEYFSFGFMPRWIYLDVPFADITYHLSNAIAPPRVYNSNQFEFEANHFSTGHFLVR